VLAALPLRWARVAPSSGDVGDDDEELLLLVLLMLLAADEELPQRRWVDSWIRRLLPSSHHGHVGSRVSQPSRRSFSGQLARLRLGSQRRTREYQR